MPRRKGDSDGNFALKAGGGGGLAAAASNEWERQLRELKTQVEIFSKIAALGVAHRMTNRGDTDGEQLVDEAKQQIFSLSKMVANLRSGLDYMNDRIGAIEASAKHREEQYPGREQSAAAAIRNLVYDTLPRILDMMMTFNGDIRMLKKKASEWKKGTMATSAFSPDQLGRLGAAVAALDARLERHVSEIYAALKGIPPTIVSSPPPSQSAGDAVDESGLRQLVRSVSDRQSRLEEAAQQAGCWTRQDICQARIMGVVEQRVGDFERRLEAKFSALQSNNGDGGGGLENRVAKIEAYLGSTRDVPGAVEQLFKMVAYQQRELAAAAAANVSKGVIMQQPGYVHEIKAKQRSLREELEQTKNEIRQIRAEEEKYAAKFLEAWKTSEEVVALRNFTSMTGRVVGKLNVDVSRLIARLPQMAAETAADYLRQQEARREAVSAELERRLRAELFALKRQVILAGNESRSAVTATQSLQYLKGDARSLAEEVASVQSECRREQATVRKGLRELMTLTEGISQEQEDLRRRYAELTSQVGNYAQMKESLASVTNALEVLRGETERLMARESNQTLSRTVSNLTSIVMAMDRGLEAMEQSLPESRVRGDEEVVGALREQVRSLAARVKHLQDFEVAGRRTDSGNYEALGRVVADIQSKVASLSTNMTTYSSSNDKSEAARNSLLDMLKVKGALESEVTRIRTHVFDLERVSRTADEETATKIRAQQESLRGLAAVVSKLNSDIESNGKLTELVTREVTRRVEERWSILSGRVKDLDKSSKDGMELISRSLATVQTRCDATEARLSHLRSDFVRTAKRQLETERQSEAAAAAKDALLDKLNHSIAKIEPRLAELDRGLADVRNDVQAAATIRDVRGLAKYADLVRSDLDSLKATLSVRFKEFAGDGGGDASHRELGSKVAAATATMEHRLGQVSSATDALR